MEQGPGQEGIKPVAKEVQLHIGEARDFINETVTFFTPAIEVENDSKVLLKDGNKNTDCLIFKKN